MHCWLEALGAKAETLRVASTLKYLIIPTKINRNYFLLPYIKFVSMKHLFKPYTALAVAAILALSATSCADDTIMSESQKLNTTTLGEEASTTH